MRHILFAGILLISFIVGAQDSTVVKPNLAIAPFMPNMYFNELSRLWYSTGETKCQGQQIDTIIYQLNFKLSKELSNKFDVIDLNRASTISTLDLLLALYQMMHFEIRDTFPQKESKFKLKLKNKDRPVEEKTEGQEADLKEQEHKDIASTYLASVFNQEKEFKAWLSSADVKYLLVISQFEVKGDYGSPYNSGRETNYEIRVHYDLYDADGTLLLGKHTSAITTNEKARFYQFLDRDLQKTVNQITEEVNAMIKKEK
ncbi:MAG: hypothetical protein JXR60_11205 [Bacteroidales bacterium]|nr:hypothetical protein [Bacteroidales bacterium]